MELKSDFIKLFRSEGFNCFPINRYPDSHKQQKAADSRYNASRTTPDQSISLSDNYGVIPGGGSIILDFDHKELFREFAEDNIKNGHMVIETPHGWHIPVKGLAGEIKKVHLYDSAINSEKAVLEIQSSDQYVIGPGCDIYDEKEETRVFYESKGSEKIFDVGGKSYDDFVDFLCKAVKVTPKTVSRSANYSMRLRFKEGKIPTPGTSNNYFFNAGMQCHSDDMTIEDAKVKIRKIYDKWEDSESFSGRSWDNIEKKIEDAYELDPLHEGRPKKDDMENQAATIAQNLLKERRIYADLKSSQLYENKRGFLENITDTLQKDLQPVFPSMKPSMYDHIKFILNGLAPELPPTNKNLKVFDNGVFDINLRKIIDTDELAEMGFKGYKYLPKTDENIPHKFIDIMFGNVPAYEHPRIRAALASALNPRLDPKMSVIHGLSGVGKTLGLTILYKILTKYQNYAMTVELSQLLTDHFIKAKIVDKTLLIISELPETYNDFAAIKALTGEEVKTERGFHQDSITFENKIKIIGTTNYLAKIPDKEKNAMYGRRLSLIHNTRQDPYKYDPTLADKVVESEGEKIISWILNFDIIDCKYEDPSTVKKEWESLSSPELEYMTRFWTFGDSSEPTSIMKLKADFEEKYQMEMPLKGFIKSLSAQGYYIYKNMVHNIIPVPQTVSKDQKLV